MDKKSIYSFDELEGIVENASDEELYELRKEIGFLGVNLALFRVAIKNKLDMPKLCGYPPRIFISYRWESAEHKEWVKKLADYLENRGFYVYLDQNEKYNEEDLDREIPLFISSIAYCRYFLIVITNAYIDNIQARKGHTSWVFDEHQQALHLSEYNRIKFIGVIKEDSELPGGCFKGNTIDARDVKDDFSILDKYFHYEGIRISDEKFKKLIDFLSSVDSYIAFGKFTKAESLINENRGFKDVPEYKMRQAELLILKGQIEDARKILSEVNSIISESSNSLEKNNELQIDLAELLYNFKEYSEALRKVIPFKKLNIEIIRTRFLIGNIMDDIGQSETAINYFLYLLKYKSKMPKENLVIILNNLGFIYKRTKQFDKSEAVLQEAVEVFSDYELALVNYVDVLLYNAKYKEAEKVLNNSLEKFPNNKDLNMFKINWNKFLKRKTPEKETKSAIVNVYYCDNCENVFELKEKDRMCGDCGTIYDNAAICPACANDGVVPLMLLSTGMSNVNIRCPICNKGAILLS
ncbi:TIR domain-containing protein [candidate division KSB1 bacterium]